MGAVELLLVLAELIAGPAVVRTVEHVHVGPALAAASGWVRGLAAARPFEDGMTAYGRGDYATALDLWKPLAERGNADAQFALGLMYDGGNGVAQDDAAALSWYRKAAEQGNATSQNNLASLYDNGQGVRRDYEAARHWYRKAAEQGYSAAQSNLGGMYLQGRGTPKDYLAALSWYRRAAEQGYAQAQDILGHLYTEGRGVPQDDVRAYLWHALAAASFATAREQAMAAASCEALAARMTPDQVAEAQRLAREWTLKQERE